VLGSTAAATARASISSPPASTTPVTVPSRCSSRSTLAPVRTTAPKPRAALASAEVKAPRPPFTSTVEPAPLPSPAAAWSSRLAVVPADHGPAIIPWMPRAAITAASSGVSNHSCA
jgi:hypothetical protein